MPTGTALGCAQCPPTRMLSASTMTAQRQERNGRRPRTGFRPGIALIAVAGRPFLRCGAGPSRLGGPGRDHRAGGGEPLHRPGHRGVDPVAYFVDAQPDARPAGLRGLRRPGAVWRFRNEGNRASFVAHPEIYGPQFGGYDPVDVARGVTVAGNPRFWLISGQRLYLFGRERSPRRLCRRSRARPARSERALAGAGAGAGAVAPLRRPAMRHAAADGSPQAMNSGTMKSVAARCRTATRRLARP